MNHTIAIVTDTNSGLDAQTARELDISLIPMPVILDGETYFENETITPQEFFQRLKAGSDVSTSQPAPGTLMDCWEALLEDYQEIVYIPMSSGLSGSCGASTMLAQEYEGRVHVVDNRRVSVTMRQSVLEARHLADQGMTGAQIQAYLQEDGMHSAIYVSVNTLEYLKKSGRVTASAAAIGTLLSIKPVLQIQGGKLDAFKKVRGMKAAMQTMIDGTKADLAGRFAGEKMLVRAAYSGDPQVGLAWQQALQEALPEYEIGLDPLPLSICCHVGDGALGVGLMKNIL